MVVFQSLFLWNSPLDSPGLWTSSACTTLGFNPCFCGTRPWTSSTFLAANELVYSPLFQSLFLWNSPLDPPCLRFIATRLYCFNPCFCGTRPWTGSSPRPTRWAARAIGFNPCFCGTRPWTVFLVRSRRSSLPLFQSLFLWNSPLDSRHHHEILQHIPIGFQSLFLWNSPFDFS